MQARDLTPGYTAHLFNAGVSGEVQATPSDAGGGNLSVALGDDQGNVTSYTVPGNALAAIAPTAAGQSATFARSQVESGAVPAMVPKASDGQGLFPGADVSGRGGERGTVKAARIGDVTVAWQNRQTSPEQGPNLAVVAPNRSTGWTGAGVGVRVGQVVVTAAGVHGSVEAVSGDTATVATPTGDVEVSCADLTVLGG